MNNRNQVTISATCGTSHNRDWRTNQGTSANTQANLAQLVTTTTSQYGLFSNTLHNTNTRNIPTCYKFGEQGHMCLRCRTLDDIINIKAVNTRSTKRSSVRSFNRCFQAETAHKIIHSVLDKLSDLTIAVTPATAATRANKTTMPEATTTNRTHSTTTEIMVTKTGMITIRIETGLITVGDQLN